MQFSACLSTVVTRVPLSDRCHSYPPTRRPFEQIIQRGSRVYRTEHAGRRRLVWQQRVRPAFQHSSVCILVSSRNADYVGRRHHIGDMPMVLPHLPDTWPLLMSLSCLRLKLLQVFASDFTMHARWDLLRASIMCNMCTISTNGAERMHLRLLIPRRVDPLPPQRHLTTPTLYYSIARRELVHLIVHRRRALDVLHAAVIFRHVAVRLLLPLRFLRLLCLCVLRLCDIERVRVYVSSTRDGCRDAVYVSRDA
jgi:hypothetical protein